MPNTSTLWGRTCLWLITQVIARTIKTPVPSPGYAGFVAVAQQIAVGRSVTEQQATVRRVLHTLVPAPVRWAARTFSRPNRWVCETNAWFASTLTHWLVGPSQRQTVTRADGSVWQSTVQIEKCRYLDESRCVGLCVNLCQKPTQRFFREDFGIPLTMTPNFEDLSCSLSFGEVPPPETPQHPCLAECPTATSRYACPKESPRPASQPN